MPIENHNTSFRYDEDYFSGDHKVQLLVTLWEKYEVKHSRFVW